MLILLIKQLKKELMKYVGLIKNLIVKIVINVTLDK